MKYIIKGLNPISIVIYLKTRDGTCVANEGQFKQAGYYTAPRVN